MYFEPINLIDILGRIAAPLEESLESLGRKQNSQNIQIEFFLIALLFRIIRGLLVGRMLREYEIRDFGRRSANLIWSFIVFKLKSFADSEALSSWPAIFSKDLSKSESQLVNL